MKRQSLGLGVVFLLLHVGCGDEEPAAPSVSPEDPSRVIEIPEEALNLREALRQARTGDTISLAPGVYEGEDNRGLVIDDLTLTIKGRDPENAALFDLDFEDQAFHIIGDSEVRIDNVIFANGRAAAGGALRASESDLTLFDTKILGCAADLGGGVLVEGGTLIVEESELRGNETLAVDGGAIFSSRGSTVRVKSSLLTGNTSAKSGGAIGIRGSELYLEDTTVASNRAADTGGGINVLAPESKVRILRSIVAGNLAGDEGLPEIAMTAISSLRIECSAIDMDGVAAIPVETIELVEGDPLFCEPLAGDELPADDGNYEIQLESPCSQPNSPCGVLIGARAVGCGS